MNPALLTVRSLAAERSHAWRSRREQLLQEACTEVAHRLANGEKVVPAIRKTARKFRTRSLGNGRRLSLSAKSLERHWYRFRTHGEAAFALRYIAGRKVQLDPLLLRLIVEGSIRQSKSVSRILKEAGGDDRAGCVSFATIRRALPAKEINRFLREERSLLKQRERADQKVLAIAAHLRELREATERGFLKKGAA